MIDIKEIEEVIGQPKDLKLEYRPILATTKEIAQILCSFANTEGGFIILGISANGEVIGLSADFQAEQFAQNAKLLLEPTPITEAQYITVKGKNIFVIQVEKSAATIRVDGKKYVRVGAHTKLSASSNIKLNTDGTVEMNENPMKNENNESGITFHAYDINLSQSYVELEKQLKDISISKTGITKDDYLTRMREGIDSYCAFHQLGNLASGMPLILKYPAYNYHAHLAFQLMIFDINKIFALLDFQHENFTGLDEFQKHVEHDVYDWIKNNSPFDNNVRLQKIMDWVEKRKGVHHKRNTLAANIGDKILDKFKEANSDVNEILMIQVVNRLSQTLAPPEKKEFNNVLSAMQLEGYISYDEGEPNFIRLGQRGHEKIYNESDSALSEITPDNNKLPVVVILTAIEEEYDAVREHLTDVTDFKRDSIIYEEGIFVFDKRPIAKIIIRECGPRNPATAQETQRALTNFKPQCIFFVGVAGSRKQKDFDLGDVIFPENVHYYEGGKSEFNSFNARPDDVKPTYSLFEIAKFERRRDDWQQLIKCDLENPVSAGIGVISSGEQVVEHYDSEIGKIISKCYNDTACIAMEEYGFLSTCRRQGVEFATLVAGVVRGVSDILEKSTDVKAQDNTNDDRRPEGAKILASKTASAFAYWLIFKLYQKSIN